MDLDRTLVWLNVFGVPTVIAWYILDVMPAIVVTLVSVYNAVVFDQKIRKWRKLFNAFERFLRSWA